MVSVAQLSFTGGEWAPSLHARNDLEKYPTAVETLLNMIIHPEGGASNRGGTEFVGEAKYAAKVCRLIPFQFSVVQSYMLEFGDSYMRVYKDGARVVEATKTITGITNATQGVVTSAAHGYANGDWVIIESVGGMTQLNGKTFVVSDQATNTFKLKDIDGNYINTTAYGTYTSGGTSSKIYELATPYVEADLELLKITQSADVLYVMHPSYAPREISRTGHTSWTISSITFGASIAAPTSLARAAGSGTGKVYVVTAVSQDGEESLVSNTVSGGAGDRFTWTPPAGSVDYYNFYEKSNDTYGWLGFAGLNSGSPEFTVPSGVDADYENAPPKSRTPFASSSNYPGVAAFFQQRLVYARTNNYPQTLFGSVTGSFKNMNVASPLRDDDAFTFTLNARQVNEIRWMVPLDVLIIGTSGGEWKMQAGRNADAVTASSVDLKVQSQWGVCDIQPIVIGGSVIFIDGSQKVVRDLAYSLEVDGYTGNDLSILANHLFRGYTLTDWCYQRHPDSIIWCVRSDGALLGLTYLREHQVWGWHRHETQGYFEAIASVSSGAGETDVYASVRRTIDGTTRRYIELFRDRLPTDDVADSYFVDCGLTYDGASTTSITGLDHLEGEEVAVLADGNVVSGLTVTSGAITLPNAAEKVHVGLGYTSDIKTLNFHYQTQQGTVADKTRYINSVVIKMKDSRSLFAGPSFDRLSEVPFRENENYGDPIALFTGDKPVAIEQAEDFRQAVICIRNTDPVPITVLSIIPRIIHGEY